MSSEMVTTIINIFMVLLFSSFIWLGFIGLVRNNNFNQDKTRKKSVRGDDIRRSEEIEYHNHAIYRDFEFFFKVTLAILGGVAYIAIQDDVKNVSAIKKLFEAAAWLQFSSGIIFSIFIFTHQKSKIERWKFHFSIWQSFLWQEYFMILSMLIISSLVKFILIPNLLLSLN